MYQNRNLRLLSKRQFTRSLFSIRRKLIKSQIRSLDKNWMRWKHFSKMAFLIKRISNLKLFKMKNPMSNSLIKLNSIWIKLFVNVLIDVWVLYRKIKMKCQSWFLNSGSKKCKTKIFCIKWLKLMQKWTFSLKSKPP